MPSISCVNAREHLPIKEVCFAAPDGDAHRVDVRCYFMRALCWASASECAWEARGAERGGSMGIGLAQSEKVLIVP